MGGDAVSALKLLPGPCKADEIAYYRAWVAELPQCSYLRSYFEGSEGQMEGLIRNDMHCEGLTELVGRKRQAEEDAREAVLRLDGLTAKLRGLEIEIRDAMRARKLLADDLEAIEGTARTIGRIVADKLPGLRK